MNKMNLDYLWQVVADSIVREVSMVKDLERVKT